MSLFAKAFILINLLLTGILVFLMATLLGQKADYKAKFHEAELLQRLKKQELKDKVGDFEAQSTNLKRSIERKKKKQTEITDSLGALNARIEVLRKQLGGVGSEVGTLSSTLNNLKQTHSRLSQRKQSLTAEIEAARKAHAAAVTGQRDVEAKTSSTASEELTKRSILNDLEKRVIDKTAKVGELERIVARIKVKFPTIKLQYTTVPLITGKVTSVSLTDDLVMINRGRDDKVKEGYEFAITRGGTRIGTLRVDRVFKGRSSARISQDGLKGKVKQGDSVATEPLKSRGGN